MEHVTGARSFTTRLGKNALRFDDGGNTKQIKYTHNVCRNCLACCACTIIWLINSHIVCSVAYPYLYWPGFVIPVPLSHHLPLLKLIITTAAVAAAQLLLLLLLFLFSILLLLLSVLTTTASIRAYFHMCSHVCDSVLDALQTSFVWCWFYIDANVII